MKRQYGFPLNELISFYVLPAQWIPNKLKRNRNPHSSMCRNHRENFVNSLQKRYELLPKEWQTKTDFFIAIHKNSMS